MALDTEIGAGNFALPALEFTKLEGRVKSYDDEFDAWKPHYEEVAKYFLPRRYQYLDTAAGAKVTGYDQARRRNNAARNTAIIDPYGTTALRSLAAGMLNGITSPARPWFSLSIAGTRNDSGQEPTAIERWKQETLRRVFAIFSGSNFYNAMAIQFLDLCCFGTSLFLIYQDYDNVIRCYNVPMGEYRLIQDARGTISGIVRYIAKKAHQVAEEFGLENCSPQLQRDMAKGDGSVNNDYTLVQIIEANSGALADMVRGAYREIVFERGTRDGKLLRLRGFAEKPFVAGRWEIIGNDTYGTSPCMDALPTVIELQQVALEKGKGIAYMNNPPVVADSVFASKPDALLPGGRTFTTNASSFGAKAVYTVNPPVAELRQDREGLRRAIDEALFNDLFRMISQLDTVRSATEIDARREEKLVLLAAVLERFENEVLDPAVKRTYEIAKRLDLLPELPPELEGVDPEIAYESILTDAQRAIGTASIERFMSFVAETGSVWPDLLGVPNAEELVRDYADRLNVPAIGLKTRDEVAAERQQQQELSQQREQALVGNELTNAAKNLSDTDVGGGQNALESLLGA